MAPSERMGVLLNIAETLLRIDLTQAWRVLDQATRLLPRITDLSDRRYQADRLNRLRSPAPSPTPPPDGVPGNRRLPLLVQFHRAVRDAHERAAKDPAGTRRQLEGITNSLDALDQTLQQQLREDDIGLASDDPYLLREKADLRLELAGAWAGFDLDRAEALYQAACRLNAEDGAQS